MRLNLCLVSYPPPPPRTQTEHLMKAIKNCGHILAATPQQRTTLLRRIEAGAAKAGVRFSRMHYNCAIKVWVVAVFFSGAPVVVSVSCPCTVRRAQPGAAAEKKRSDEAQDQLICPNESYCARFS